MGVKQSPIRRVVPINASNGAATIIKSTVSARYVEIVECPPTNYDNNANPFSPQGLLYQLPADNYVAGYGLIPAAVWSLGDQNWARDRAVGSPTWTDPSGQSAGGTPYMQVKSATTTATQVEVREYL